MPLDSPRLESIESNDVLLNRIRDLQGSLDESNETLRAFTSGEVDAIVASGPGGDQVYTLKGADETYRVMVQQMAEGALTLASDGLILFSNQQFASMLGCPLERVIGSPFLHFVAPEDTGVASALISLMSGGKAEVRLIPEKARLTPDGATFLPVYLAVRKVILDGADCCCLIVTDLSAQKRYAEMLAVLEAVPVGVFISHDAECRTMVGNRMAHQSLRAPPGTNLSASFPDRGTPRGWREVRDGKDIPPGELPMQTAARSGRPVRDYECDIEFDDGTSRCWLGNAVPLFDELCRPRGAVGAFVDITGRKRAEETLEAANKELRSFVHTLTHGLREPLHSVLNSIQRLAKENPGDLVEIAVTGASKMETLLKELLRYWEISERTGVSLSPVDCNHALVKACHDLEEPIRRSGAVLTADPLPTVVADEVMLVEVLRNLIGNSIRYSGEAVPRIHISAVRSGERWLFSVRDNGIGIHRADAERVFGMFSSSPADGTFGSGIGLALCRKVVERHGGRIWVESEAGQGAAFRFTLPIYLDSALPR